MWEIIAGLGNEKDRVGNDKDDVENAKDLIIRAIQYK